MPRGTRPIPTLTKMRRGNPGKQRLNLAEPLPATTDATPPAGLEGEALAYWEEHAPELIRLGLITSVDKAEFALACRMRVKGLADLEKRPTAAMRALEMSSRIGARYGIGASDRSRITAPGPAPVSRWAGLIGA